MSKVSRGIIYFLIMAIIICGLFYGFVQVLKPDIPEVDHWEEYRIKPGDTLWSITPYKDGYDIRDLIQEVIDHNSLTSANLIAYEIIEIPSWR